MSERTTKPVQDSLFTPIMYEEVKEITDEVLLAESGNEGMDENVMSILHCETAEAAPVRVKSTTAEEGT